LVGQPNQPFSPLADQNGLSGLSGLTTSGAPLTLMKMFQPPLWAGLLFVRRVMMAA
jgi:hypothetical protein